MSDTDSPIDQSRSMHWSERVAIADATTPVHLTHGTQKMTELMSTWGQFADKHVRDQKKNPFSGEWAGRDEMSHLPSRYDSNYGRPVEGSLTEARGRKAVAQIDCEISYMCGVIEEMGDLSEDRSRILLAFGRLFDAYVRISSKLVGMLLRARRRGLLTFTGEMLFQGRDNEVIIELFLPCPLLSNGSECSGSTSLLGASSSSANSSVCADLDTRFTS